MVDVQTAKRKLAEDLPSNNTINKRLKERPNIPIVSNDTANQSQSVPEQKDPDNTTDSGLTRYQKIKPNGLRQGRAIHAQGNNQTHVQTQVQVQAQAKPTSIKPDMDRAAFTKLTTQSNGLKQAAVLLKLAQPPLGTAPSTQNMTSRLVPSSQPEIKQEVTTMQKIDVSTQKPTRATFNGLKSTSQSQPTQSLTNAVDKSPADTKQPASSPAETKKTIPIRFFIVAQTKPKRNSQLWQEGRLKGCTLKEFQDTVAKATCKGTSDSLMFKLELQYGDFEIPVGKECEAQFDVMRKMFTQEIVKAWKADQNGGVDPVVWIEPIYNQSAPKIDDKKVDVEEWDL